MLAWYLITTKTCLLTKLSRFNTSLFNMCKLWNVLKELYFLQAGIIKIKDFTTVETIGIMDHLASCLVCFSLIVYYANYSQPKIWLCINYAFVKNIILFSFFIIHTLFVINTIFVMNPLNIFCFYQFYGNYTPAQVTWLDGHSLIQTVLICLYVHNPYIIEDLCVKVNLSVV